MKTVEASAYLEEGVGWIDGITLLVRQLGCLFTVMVILRNWRKLFNYEIIFIKKFSFH